MGCNPVGTTKPLGQLVRSSGLSGPSPLAQRSVAQLVFLVLFSYAFFFEGYAGLTVTVGAVATLFVLMQMTGGVDWEEAFARKDVSPTATR